MPNEDIKASLLQKEILKKKGIRYLIVCKEFHKDGEEHHHVFISLEAPLKIGREQMRIFDIEKRVTQGEGGGLGGGFIPYHPNIKSCKSPKDAIEYVKKGGQWEEYGICPYKVHISTRDKNKLLREKSLLQLVESGEISIFKVPQLAKAISILQNELGNVERQPPEVYWFYGPTGTGKTRTAYKEAKEEYPNSYWISHESSEWFDGYTDQRCCILDDIRSNTWPMPRLLRILDRYPIQVPIKGGFVWWRPERIYITAPGRPEDIYKNYTTGQPFDHIEQLIRRVTKFVSFEETEPSEDVLAWKD